MKRQGFSFIEVLFAVAVFAIAAIVLVTTFQGGAREAKKSEDQLKAITIAQREIERVKQIAALGRGSIEKFWAQAGKTVRTYTVDDFYKVSVAINPAYKATIGSSQAEVGEVVVVVAWYRRSKGNQEVVFYSLFDQAYH